MLASEFGYGITPSRGGFSWGHGGESDLHSSLLEISRSIRHKEPTCELLKNVFLEVGALSDKPGTKYNPSYLLEDIAREAVRKLCAGLSDEDFVKTVLAIGKEIPFKKTNVLLEFEKALVLAADSCSDRRAKLIFGACLARLPKEEIEHHVSLQRGKEGFLNYFAGLLRLDRIDDTIEFKLAITIHMLLKVQSETSWLRCVLFRYSLSAAAASGLIQALPGLPVPKPFQGEIEAALRNFERLPCVEKCISDKRTITYRLQISTFLVYKERLNVQELFQVSKALGYMLTTFRPGEEEPLYKEYFGCVQTVLKACTIIQSLSTFARLTEIFFEARHQKFPFIQKLTQELTAKCFPEIYFNRLETHLTRKDVFTHADPSLAYQLLEGLTDEGFDLLRKLYEAEATSAGFQMGWLVFLNRTFTRFNQLRQTDFFEFETAVPGNLELFQMAFAIEVPFAHEAHFKARTSSKLVIPSSSTPFGRQLVFDFADKSIGISSKTALSTLKGEGE